MLEQKVSNTLRAKNILKMMDEKVSREEIKKEYDLFINDFSVEANPTEEDANNCIYLYQLVSLYLLPNVTFGGKLLYDN
jgi:hypothetical protein